MKLVTKVTYTFDDGSMEEFTNERGASDAAWQLHWLSPEERAHKLRGVVERLKNIDPSIFTENLFEDE